MDQVNPKLIARTLVAVVLLQIVTIGGLVCVLVSERGAGETADPDYIRYQQSVAEYRKTMEEYREDIARYQVALDEWKRLTGSERLQPSPAKNLEPSPTPEPTSDLRTP